MLGVLTLAGVGACGDEFRGPAAPLAPTAGPSRTVIQDDGINQQDSYVVADVTTYTTTTLTSSEPFVDPATDQTVTSVTVDPPPTTVRVESGYEYGGALRVNSYVTYEADNDGDPAGTVMRSRVSGNTFELYNSSGQIIADADPTGDNLPGGMALLDSNDNVNVTGSTVVDASGEGSGSTSQPFYARLAAETGAPGAQVTRVSPTELRIESPLDLGGTASHAGRAGVGPGAGRPRLAAADDNAKKSDKVVGKLTRTYEKRGDKWVLQEAKTEAEVTSSRGIAKHLQRAVFANVKWHENKK